MSDQTPTSLNAQPSPPSRNLVLAIGLAAMVAVGGGAALTQGVQPVYAQGSGAVPLLVQNQLPPESFSQLAETVMPSVVRVEVSRDRDGYRGERGQHGQHMRPGLQKFFHDFFQPQSAETYRNGDHKKGHSKKGRHHTGLGSGFVLDDAGHIVTNHHVVAGADAITVTLNDGTEIAATLVGSDPKTDLALLKVETELTLSPVRFADSETTKVGDWVVAVGNPFGLGGTVTAGIVSARGRDIGAGPYDDFLQIDASINKGNSGGPSFNLAGEVVGVNTAILAPGGGNIGIGFAIPANLTQQIVADLMDDGTVSRGWLGVRLQPVDQDIANATGLLTADGALIAGVGRRSPAADVLSAGDIVTAVDGQPVENPKALARLIADNDPGETVNVTLWRDGTAADVSVTLGDQADVQKRHRKARADKAEEPVFDGFGLALKETRKGVRVTAVDPRGLAAEKGVRPGDRIAAVGDFEIHSVDDLDAALSEARSAGKEAVLIKVARRHHARFVALPLQDA